MREDQLVLLIESFKKCSEKDDLYLMNELVQVGFDIDKAEKYVIFIPIAFGRYYLRGRFVDLEFNNFYRKGSSLKNYLLLEDEIYTWAYSLARKNEAENLLDKKEYSSIIYRSPEIKNVVKGLKLNKQIDGAKFRTLLNVGNLSNYS